MHKTITIFGSLLLGIIIGATAIIFTPTIIEQFKPTYTHNYSTAFSIFKNSYHAKHVIIFTESSVPETFFVAGIRFTCIPATDSVDKSSGEYISNTADLMNGMAVMLACKWLHDKRPEGKELLHKLIALIPNRPVYSPSNRHITVKDLSDHPETISEEADQWDWKMVHEAN